jgi:hypothetical protein
MEIALPEAEAGPVARERGSWARLKRHPGLLITCGYLALAVALDWRLWAGFGTAAPTGDPGPADYDLMAWFVRYAATAVVHGHLPALVTTALNAPTGINLMWNNTILFPAVVLTPVTLLAGPNASLTVLTTLGFAGSAAAMYWLLRRRYANWGGAYGGGASVGASALGGLVFGFSPGMVNAGDSHYGMQFAVLVPLMVEAVVSIVTGRGRPLTAGIWLGLLASAQFYTGEELLLYTVIVCVLLVAALAVSRPAAVPGRLPRAVLGLGVAAVVALLLSAYGLWRQFHGPLTEHGDPWHIANDGNGFGAFVNPQSDLFFHTASSAAFAAYRANSAEYVAYLGPPLLIGVALVTVWYWRDLRVRVAGVVWLVMEALSVGVNSWWLPFHWLAGLPLFSDMFPMRMSLLADGGAAAVLAFGLDLAWSAKSRAAEPVDALSQEAVSQEAVSREAVSQEALSRESGPRDAGPQNAGPRRGGDLWRRAMLVVVALLAIAPLVPRPVGTITSAPVPAGWDAVFTRLHLSSSASVLVVPLPYSQQAEAMLWQADTGQPGELVAGWFLGPNASGQAVPAYWGPRFTDQAMSCLSAFWQGTAPVSNDFDRGCATALRSALGYWHPAAVVADTGPGSPLAQFLTGQLGQPTVQDGQVVAWRTALASAGSPVT